MVPNEFGKAVCDPEDFRRLCRHFFVRPRLESVLSKEPQLRLVEVGNLRQVQQLFWRDARDAFSKRVKEAGKVEPPGCCATLRAEADRLVEEWWRPADRPSRPVPMPEPHGREYSVSTLKASDPLSALSVQESNCRLGELDAINSHIGVRVVLSSITATLAGYLSLNVGDEVFVQYKGSAMNDDEGWLYGKKTNGEAGWFPVATLQPHRNSENAECGKEMQKVQNAVAGARCDDKSTYNQIAIADWDASVMGSEYISLLKGDLLQTNGCHEAGWAWAVHSERLNRSGWFPPSYAKDSFSG